MFQSDVLDFFSRVPAWVVPLIYVPMITGLLWWASVGHGVGAVALVGLFAAGWFVWSLMEYWLHRTLFHWVPPFSWGPKFHFFLHGVHHEWHQDKYRLVMPPAASLFVAVVVYAVLTLLGLATQTWLGFGWIYGLFAGIVWGYLVYDMTHYYVHHFKPKSKVMLKLRAHHMKHHHNARFKEKKYGVSMTVWDHVFGTYE